MAWQLATLDHPRLPVLRGHIVTDYNAIAHTYREAKSLPIRQYSEACTFFQVLGAVDGLVVLDVA